MNDLRSADLDNDVNIQIIQNNKPAKRRRIVFDDEE